MSNAKTISKAKPKAKAAVKPKETSKSKEKPKAPVKPTKPVSKPKTPVKPASKTNAVQKTKTAQKPKTVPKTKTASKPVSGSKTASGSKAVSGAKAASGSKTVSGSRTAPSSKAVSGTKAASGAKAISGSRAASGAKAASSSKAVPGSKTTPKPKTTKAKGRTFLVDQKVVYPSQGVGVIKEIVQKKFKDAKIPYYIIYLEVTDMTIMVPVDRAVELGIRPTVSREEANRALELIKEDFEPIPSDWKMRYQMNLDLLKKGSIRDIASIVRSLYHRSKVKELPILERKLYDSALKLFVDEVTISLRRPKEEVESLIFSRLELE